MQQALALAPTIGIPHQNFVVGDRDGHIGWAIYGRVPAARLAGPRIPAAVDEHRAAGSSGWLEEPAHPMAIDPPVGRIWTANARVTSDPDQERAIGGDTASLGAEYDFGARAAQIRADLLALDRPATPADMLRIQLDDRAVLLGRWREVLLGLLDGSSLSGHPARAQFRSLIEHWDAAADTGFGRLPPRATVARPDRGAGVGHDPGWPAHPGGCQLQRSHAVPGAAAAAAAGTAAAPAAPPLRELAATHARRGSIRPSLSFSGECGDLDRCTWGQQNTIRIQHPLSRALPFLSALLDMPTLELPGDHDMPRVQGMTFGSSERFACFARARSGRLFPYAWGRERQSAVALLSSGIHGMGQRGPAAFPAGSPGTSDHACTPVYRGRDPVRRAFRIRSSIICSDGHAVRISLCQPARRWGWF